MPPETGDALIRRSAAEAVLDVLLDAEQGLRVFQIAEHAGIGPGAAEDGCQELEAAGLATFWHGLKGGWKADA